MREPVTTTSSSGAASGAAFAGAVCASASEECAPTLAAHAPPASKAVRTARLMIPLVSMIMFWCLPNRIRVS